MSGAFSDAEMPASARSAVNLPERFPFAARCDNVTIVQRSRLLNGATTSPATKDDSDTILHSIAERSLPVAHPPRSRPKRPVAKVWTPLTIPLTPPSTAPSKPPIVPPPFESLVVPTLESETVVHCRLPSARLSPWPRCLGAQPEPPISLFNEWSVRNTAIHGRRERVGVEASQDWQRYTCSTIPADRLLIRGSDSKGPSELMSTRTLR
jgi:hypothetical protein